jgi:hypothetical protein
MLGEITDFTESTINHTSIILTLHHAFTEIWKCRGITTESRMQLLMEAAKFIVPLGEGDGLREYKSHYATNRKVDWLFTKSNPDAMKLLSTSMADSVVFKKKDPKDDKPASPSDDVAAVASGGGKRRKVVKRGGGGAAAQASPSAAAPNPMDQLCVHDGNKMRPKYWMEDLASCVESVIAAHASKLSGDHLKEVFF